MSARTAILDRKALKAEYLDCLAARTSSAQTFQQVIRDLHGIGVLRETLFQWGVAAGYGKITVGTLLSRVFCSLGLRQRKAGAGRKPCREALELLAHTRQQYGNRALRVLRAAYRLGRTQEKARGDDRTRVDAAPVGIRVPKLLPLKLIDGPQLAAGRRLADQSGRRKRDRISPMEKARKKIALTSGGREAMVRADKAQLGQPLSKTMPYCRTVTR